MAGKKKSGASSRVGGSGGGSRPGLGGGGGGGKKPSSSPSSFGWGSGGGWAGPPSSSSRARPPASSSGRVAPAHGGVPPKSDGAAAATKVPIVDVTGAEPHQEGRTEGGAVAPAATAMKAEEEKFYALVVDSGAIIKHAGYSTLHNSAERYLTVPSVIEEIRDAKAREHLESLPFDLVTRQPSPEAMVRVAEFARKTGDYRSLSGPDLQVLALLYDLEVEGCGGDVSHVRKEPKRALAGRIRSLNRDTDKKKKEQGEGKGGKDGSDPAAEEGDGEKDGEKENGNDAEEEENAAETADDAVEQGASFFEGRPEAVAPELLDEDADAGEETQQDVPKEEAEKPKPSSWAQLVNPSASVTTMAEEAAAPSAKVDSANVAEVGGGDTANKAVVSFSSIVEEQNREEEEEELGGQFDDASEEDDGEWIAAASLAAAARTESGGIDDDDEGRILAAMGSDDDDSAGISDEECDVVVLDPEEAEERKRAREAAAAGGIGQVPHAATATAPSSDDDELKQDLASDFPSLAAASAAPYEGSDDEGAPASSTAKKSYWDDEEERRKAESLKPVTKTKDGKLYNSFRKYGDVVKKGGVKHVPVHGKGGRKNGGGGDDAEVEIAETQPAPNAEAGENSASSNKSRIVGGAAALAGQSADFAEEDDDGEGWIVSPADLRALRAAGALDPSRTPDDLPSRQQGEGEGEEADGAKKKRQHLGPPPSKRAACATTDFAMQNVILQMNLTVLTVDGVRVRRVKSWVTRCDACFTVYASGDASQASGELGRRGLDRMFCDRCGSNALSRIACSVDGRTGRLRLHLSKKYRHNTRGSKFSMPKPGKGNRFEGDILLTEDQLLYGAWNQKMKKGSGRKEVQSIFGSGVASDVGCLAGVGKRDDIKVGFGRKNPNATKFGRERRGKKKKSSTDKACGLRRY